MRLLLIEDDDTTIKVIKKKIESLNIELDYAQTGSDAVNYYRSNDYDVIIVDLMFPGKDVYQIILEINLTLPNSKIIIYSSNINNEVSKLLSNYDIYDIISKEAGHYKLIETIKNLQVDKST